MNTLTLFKQITTLIFDVDGVLTDGTILITEKGELLRTMNVQDGFAIKQAIAAGLHIAIITGGRSKGVIKRLQGLGIVDIYAGAINKLDVFEEFILTYDLEPHKILYMGDDLPDYEVLQTVGLATCPADAVPEIQEIAQYISPHKGGQGCVRDVIQKVLKLHGKSITNS